MRLRDAQRVRDGLLSIIFFERGVRLVTGGGGGEAGVLHVELVIFRNNSCPTMEKNRVSVSAI